MTELTLHQITVLNTIQDYCEKKQRPPSIRELADTLGVTKTAAYKTVDYIIKKGFLEKDEKGRLKMYYGV